MLTDYQLERSQIGTEILLNHGIVYYAIQMRVGKTRICLKTAELYFQQKHQDNDNGISWQEYISNKKVFFVTKKAAIKSVIKDFRDEKFPFQIKVNNFEQLHKEKPIYDLYIADEASSFGAYAKPTLRARAMKKLVGTKPLILSSGTPTPESYSQIFHQLWLSDNSIYKQYKTFYKWANAGYVNKKFIHQGAYGRYDYSDADKNRIDDEFDIIRVGYTQKQAGFKHYEVDERVIYVDLPENIHSLMKHLIDNRIYYLKDGSGEIVCDTPVKLQSKLHQLSSGTIITEQKNALILDTTKAKYIRDNYKGKKIAIFYEFQAEGEALKSVFPKGIVTKEPEEFNDCKEKIYINQVRAGSMGVNLSTADVLIFYSIDFSATQYWQARDRLKSLSRDTMPQVHFIFSRNSIEDSIYEAVQNKKDYTVRHFQSDIRRKQMRIGNERTRYTDKNQALS